MRLMTSRIAPETSDHVRMRAEAKALFARGDTRAAEPLCLALLHADPKDAAILAILASIRVSQKRASEAQVLIAAALARDPGNGRLNLEYAGILETLWRPQEAAAAYEKTLAILDAALAQKPDAFKNLIRRGKALRALDRPQEAFASFSAASALRPLDATAHAHAASALLDLGRPREALHYLAEALRIDPDCAEAHYRKAITHLRLGEFAEGWAHHQWRWKMPVFCDDNEVVRRGHLDTGWNGERVAGTLLAWSEQGLGEEILYAGMAPELIGRADRVVLEVSDRLVALFARSFPAATVVAYTPGAHSEKADAKVPFGSLGRHFRRSWEDFPRREAGYLVPDPARVAALRAGLQGDGRRLVGLTWRSYGNVLGRFKSTTLRELEPVLRLPDCRFIDLQYGDTLAEREEIERDLGVKVEKLADLDTMKDLDGLAALMSACDAVVAVSGANAHLAGAVGCHTWVMVPAGRGKLWFWFQDGDTSPWYAHVRIHRQAAIGGWHDVIAGMASELAEFLARKSPNS